ncbi:MAG: divalent metal cation transporter [Candidatus Hinthialibacter antarcticus]|nr:divalent metal cation transporter [Candidatus Hinthialibacter antarcticus]
MNLTPPPIEFERQQIVDARKKGPLSLFGVYARLSGPGWLQSAMTLGGGSLASSLYLGVLGGFSLLWLQPMAVFLGIVMLGAIGYVTLSIGERPFGAIKNHINPVLAWGWALAALLANMVWAMPQYSLANAVVQQNLLPNVFGAEGTLGDFWGKVAITLFVLVATTMITFLYDNKGFGVKVYEWMLKGMVVMIVACFFGVVMRLTFSEEGLDWSGVLAGFIPTFNHFWKPDISFSPLLDQLSESARAYWSAVIVNKQQDVMVAATANAVGINMTFLLPYSMLSRGWDKDFRGLSIFDLFTGMMIPFVVVTGFVIIASSSQFHMKPAQGLLDKQGNVIADSSHRQFGQYDDLLKGRLARVSESEVQIIPAERMLAATLVKRDAADLSQALTPLTGDTVANWVFGLGVLGMTLSSITLMMLISGFVICEIFNFPHGGWQHRLGCMAAATGTLGPFIWSGKTLFWLAVPTSVFNYTLLPLAYITFFIMMNSKRLLGENIPRGMNRVVWNTLMGTATVLTTIGAVWQVSAKAGIYGIIAIIVFTIVVLFGFTLRKPENYNSTPKVSE